MKIKEVNAETGEEIIRDANEAELALLERDQQEAETAELAKQTKQAQKSVILEKLGLSEEEVKVLLS